MGGTFGTFVCSAQPLLFARAMERVLFLIILKLKLEGI